MDVITSDVLSAYNIYSHADYRTVQRGNEIFRQQQASVSEFRGDSAACQVRGPRFSETVEFRLVARKQLQVICSCPAWDGSRACEHIAAGIMALNNYLFTEGRNHWEYKLSLALSAPPRKTPGVLRQRYALLFGLKKSSYYQTKVYSLEGYYLKVSDWSSLEKLGAPVEPEAFNELLSNDKTWRQRVQAPYQAINPEGCINLPPEAVALVNLFQNTGRFYSEKQPLASYLTFLARLNAPIFQVENYRFGERVEILNEPVEIEAALGRSGNGLVLQAGLTVNDRLFTMVKESFDIVDYNPPWVLAGNYLAPVKNPQSLSLLSSLPMIIPANQEERFRDHYLREIAQRIPIKGDVVTWEDVKADPVPRLYLYDEEGTLRASLRFGYGDYEVAAHQLPSPMTMIDQPDSWGLVRVHRQAEREQFFYQMLTNPVYRLKRGGRELPQGTFELRARAHPFDFLLHSVPLLTEAGFEIYGEEKLKVGRINRSLPTISLMISSGIDWFDLEAVVRYGDQEVSLRDIRKAVRRNERYIKLADGSVGRIPEVWLERYKHLFEMAKETDQGLRVADFHLPLVDELLEEAALKQVAPEFEQRRSALRAFDRIRPQPIPAGFQGELRPYQKAGLDWLHFLHEYHLGGCLADDMGLGKTIQVLAFLQSLRDAGQAGPASLLVVPKSLLANWQREAERFTPGLRFLEYVGNFRAKDVNQFNEYDVILTTYGTMLRDIDLLRTYRFHYAILDESQAIKNPNAQSSKAARLLIAEHRLVMTGTPVENNTFELWSQFAFLNPGLLGNLEYFKREFALPIESKQDEHTAQLLRRLVYPFILRRTKQQVAPELPPRTERILYTSMVSAQKKLYVQTRDRYRGILLGMIESEGVDNVRMKILEGLLRLRQICIHPVLVEPTYRGDAPKFELLFETLDTLRSENHKALVFSQFVQTLHMVRQELDKQRVPYAYLDGQTHNRQEQVDRFQTDPSVRFFLISLKAGGLGLNLTAADYVIHLDPWWNPAVEMQASDRAHRIGQDKPVFIFKIIARESVEEKILQLQERKRVLVDQLIATESSFFKSLTADDVKVLFS